MSAVAYLLTALVIGGLLILFVARQYRALGTTPSRLPLLLISIAWMSYGFALTTILGRLIWGRSALPRWSELTGHLWLPAFGLLCVLGLINPKNSGNPTQRTLGYILIVVGTLNSVLDLYELLAGN